VTFAVMVGAMIVLGVLFPNRILQTDWMNLGTEVYLSLLYLSIFASIFSLTLLTKASEHLSSGHFTAYTFSTPFWVAILDYNFLGNRLESYVFLGGAFILLSLVLLFVHSERLS
jgi:drug/metabolite transporter (DMT)-like permease